jgi:hypothetical protein
VIYDLELQERLVRQQVQVLCLRNVFDIFGGLAGIVGLRLFSWFFSECLNCFKDSGYSQEEEWRVIRFGRDEDSRVLFQPKWRASGGRLIPYTTLNFTRRSKVYKGKLPIRVISYGPTLNAESTERALHLLLETYGYTVRSSPEQSEEHCVAIRRSTIPFVG